MADKDKVLEEVARRVVVAPLEGEEAILFRQEILRDCLNNAELTRELYALAVETIESEKKNHWGLLMGYPDTVLRRSVEVLTMFVSRLRKLRSIAEKQASCFKSAGFQGFFAMIRAELDAEYFAEIQYHLKQLKLNDGVLMSAELQAGNKGGNYVLRKPLDIDRSWWKRLFVKGPPVFTYQLHPRDEQGARALSELQDRGVNLVANALAQSNDHILSFFTQMPTELAFYIGCLNLHERLAGIGVPICFPIVSGAGGDRHSVEQLCDPCLALNSSQPVVGNDLHADGKNLIIITGANQGGKSTFLRAIGLAQLMMQAGMFVAATAFRANIARGVFTHFKREEDTTMKSGKLDEELGRMDEIVDHVASGSLMLFNESFAATNEREGSEIARQIVEALTETGVKAYFVTHLFEFAHGLHERNLRNTMFLRAERREDGARTFKLTESAPLQTSFGQDLYDEIFWRAHT
ncbi:DNA mismatch repair protein MutS [Mesorhizobium sp. VK25A]|uniref:DNA mismatch repair protein MutS n=1 Tax=Mesorhizobium vachelliae TaxID=3072309 RepID=A0ABU5A4H1_9HYPH|nr:MULTISPECIES: DNA mismatch repair protein MutS [unclassified Mesorhizobium]MDX8532532.1 DNA mismatch repair protein MutS [Mesorhizobium sp. VK25D]MDX8547822.1 DNA mismatch repair protein MutS [Mesorhizobium sp. VK25A]